MMTDDEITEKWIRTAKEIGFSEAGVLNPETLKVMPLVRETCAEDKCHAYNHNWTCPPACGTLGECERRMRAYKRGILVQTTGVLRRDIDTRIYRETEKLHTEYLKILREQMMEEFPDMLMLGAGGCRICGQCAYPKPCRFPEKAISSMEAYGLFVTQVCRDNNLKYYYGPRTITYTGCVLF